MLYRAIGLMSGSSLDGLDIVYAELLENAGKWSYEILAADCYSYPKPWKERLQNAVRLSALDYQLLHAEYGHYLGAQVNQFIQEKNLHFKVGLVASHGHTTFHVPSQRMTAQLGDGAAIAAETGLPVVSDLRSLDVAFGGQGAPIVPFGEKLLFSSYDLFQNLGGIANISLNLPGGYTAYDVCPANRVLNLLMAREGKEFDEGGALAATGTVDPRILSELDALDYYRQPYPKSLANNFGTDIVFPILSAIPAQDGLRTAVEHIASQIAAAFASFGEAVRGKELMVTGGGAFNSFLIERLKILLQPLGITPIVPDYLTVQYKEALIMALLGVLRWRQENTVLSSVTGASRDSIGGAVWIGQEA
jgi:anhydro-N-acetylmuramic acid kinase